MAKIEVTGVSLSYELIGKEGPAVVITPGGRYSKDTPGVRRLAEAIAASGYRVLIWDRPNCGEADLSFDGASDAQVCVAALSGLLKALDLGPALLVGGSAGSRQSVLMALRYPEQVNGLFIFWMSGGPIGLAVASMHYCGTSAIAAAQGGMEKVAELAIFEESLARNPRNRTKLLEMDPKTFIAKMQNWTAAFFPSPGCLLPGYANEELSNMMMPVMIVRGDELDLFHPRSTSEELHRAIPGSQLVEPVWGEGEWERRVIARAERGETLFTTVPLLAPQILNFFNTIV
jgi:pimeloyl-ACP methyl ester carboxylesterase